MYMQNPKNEYFDLLRQWCDTLIELQITEKKRRSLYGGILCPSCARVHGRCADAMYPMMVMYERTGEEKYLNCAKMLFGWIENNMARPDGSYINDSNSAWKGITVFMSAQLGECLIYHGHLLDEKTRQLWTRRLDECAAFLCEFIENTHPNVNYPISCAASLAIAAKVLDNERYRQKSHALAHDAAKYFTEEGLIFGEGHPWDKVSPKGLRHVDLGYNVEESLPSLVTYMMVSGDASILPQVTRSMKEHLKFMLPDGGWDNSWGSRSAKWTYWGSRTSDGCQIGYAYLGKDYPEFAEAAQRNFELYRACTHNGLLHGGPMYHTAEEPPCVHHTFCHAKALAFMVDHNFQKPSPRVLLPRERAQGLEFFPTPRTWLIAKGDWRATFTDSDLQPLYAFGGALTMLWHRKTGPVLAASMRDYTLVEPNNMQLPQAVAPLCQTPRIELWENGRRYLNINDFHAQAAVTSDDGLVMQARGILRDPEQSGAHPYHVKYTVTAGEVTISASTGAQGAVYCLPVISRGDEEYTLEEKRAVIHHGLYRIIVETNGKLSLAPTGLGRVFNPVGGFQTIPFQLSMKKDAGLTISLRIEQEE